ncbi:MAG: hypothetical protein IKH05_02270 [Bacteroidaceae bacterium]|nr:hypothetical protein [Bacteroidaceae bacterium]
MTLKAGTYSFICYGMPWTEFEIGVGLGNFEIEVSLELSDGDIEKLVCLLHWAWDNEWFEHSTSETVSTMLLKQHVPYIYIKVYQQVHKQFCELYPNSENVEGFGVYEIFIPDIIVDYAEETYERQISVLRHRWGA